MFPGIRLPGPWHATWKSHIASKMVEQENKTTKLYLIKWNAGLPRGGREGLHWYHSEGAPYQRKCQPWNSMEMHFSNVTTDVSQNPPKMGLKKGHKASLTLSEKPSEFEGQWHFFYPPLTASWASTPIGISCCVFWAPIKPNLSSNDCKGNYWSLSNLFKEERSEDRAGNMLTIWRKRKINIQMTSHID